MHLAGNQTLKSLNLRATPKRLAILGLLGEEMSYLSPEDICHRLKGQFSRIGLPTVYRNLEDVDICGLENIEREVGERIGGKVLSHLVQVNGLCRACAAGEPGIGAEGMAS